MKKLLLVFASLMILTAGLFAQTTSELNSAISTSAREISKVLPAKANVAVVNFFSDTDELSNYIANQMIKGISNAGLQKVLERDPRKMALVDAEQDYQYSGAVSDSSMVEIGYKLGAQYLVYGTFDQLGGMLQFSVQATNVETAEILYYQSYTIQSSSTVTQLLGEKIELSTLYDFMEAISRCDRKMSALEANKKGAIDSSNDALMSRYAELMQAVYQIEKDPWESTAEYDARIKAQIDALTKKRDGELEAINSASGPKYDQQIRSVQAQRNQIVTDLKNTTFVLKNASLQTYIGEFDPEAKPKNWPLSVKSIDKYVVYTYNGKYKVNDADVKTEYLTVEAARAANDLSGEIRYKVLQNTSNSSSFDIFVDSVRLNIASSGAVLVNESVKKITGTVDAAKIVDGGNTAKAKPVVAETKKAEPAPAKTTVNTKSTTTTTVSNDKVSTTTTKTTTTTTPAKTTTNSTPVKKPFSFFDNENIVSVCNSSATARHFVSVISYEGQSYPLIIFNGHSSKEANNGAWLELQFHNLKAEMRKGNTIKFKMLGDGNVYTLWLELDNSNGNGEVGTRYIKRNIKTKKDKIIEVEIPYSSLVHEEWTKKAEFNSNNILSMGICADLYNSNWYHSDRDYFFEVFDIRVFTK